ncbi:MAG: primosomal protein N' [Candidatus Spechtbacteria bacterium]|nr:primosomal protein N' [Candidatus Spechtbacteria bacterium]
MFIVSIAPLNSIPRPASQILDYFSRNSVSVGQLVEVPLNRRKTLGIVFACRDVQDARMEIKNSPFPLKSIFSIVSQHILPEEYLQFARWLSDYYYASLGTVIKRMIPSSILKKPSLALDLPNKIKYRKKPSDSTQGKLHGMLILGAGRVNEYKKILASGRRGQALFLMPDLVTLSALAKQLDKLEVLYSGLGATKQRDLWLRARRGESLKLAGTRLASLMPFADLSQALIENPQDPSHTSWDQNPHTNSVRAMLWLHDHFGISLTLGSECPTIEIQHTALVRNWNISSTTPRLSPKPLLIDMRNELKEKNFSILSKQVQNWLADANKKGGRVTLFIHRKGFASGLLCRDCGHIIFCTECSVPMVYHRSNNIHMPWPEPCRRLVCHRCGKRDTPPTVCPKCQSDRIKYMGGGTQKVQEEIEILFPELKVCRIDSDAAQTFEAQREIIKDFNEGKYDVLIGTHFSLKPLAYSPVAYSAIISIDPLLSLPDYRMGERVFDIVQKLRAMCAKEYAVQTYHPEAPVLQLAMQNKWNEFARQEIPLRKMLKWPPFSQIIRLAYEHKDSNRAQQDVLTTKKRLETQIKYLAKDYPSVMPAVQLLGPSPAFVPKVNNWFLWYIIVKWPVARLGDPVEIEARNRLLDILPKGWDIDVDPIDLI